jgi:hypothetical protein
MSVQEMCCFKNGRSSTALNEIFCYLLQILFASVMICPETGHGKDNSNPSFITMIFFVSMLIRLLRTHSILNKQKNNPAFAVSFEIILTLPHCDLELQRVLGGLLSFGWNCI